MPLDIEERVQWIESGGGTKMNVEKCQFVDEFGPETLE